MKKEGVLIALMFAFVLFSATFASAHEGGITGWFVKFFSDDVSTHSAAKYETQLSPEDFKKGFVGSSGSVTYKGEIRGGTPPGNETNSTNPGNPGNETNSSSGGGPGNGTNVSCSDECSYAGQTICFGSYVRTCGNWDSDSCLDLTSGVLCSEGCSNGQCVVPGGNETNSSSGGGPGNGTNASLPDAYPLAINWTYGGTNTTNGTNGSTHLVTIHWSAYYSPHSSGGGSNLISLSVYNSHTGTWRVIGGALSNNVVVSGYQTAALMDYDSKLRLTSDANEVIAESNEANNILEVDLTHTACSNSQCIVAEGLLPYECTSHIQCLTVEEPEQPPQKDTFWRRFFRAFQTDSTSVDP